MSQRETHPFQEQQGEPEFQSEIESLDVFPHPTAELDVDQERLQLAIEAAIVQAHRQRLGQEQAELEIRAQELAERRAQVERHAQEQAELERRAQVSHKSCIGGEAASEIARTASWQEQLSAANFAQDQSSPRPEPTLLLCARLEQPTGQFCPEARGG